jgi:hypothetical protein
VIVAVTLALSYLVYSAMRTQTTGVDSSPPVLSSRSYSVYGTQSLRFLQVNSSVPTNVYAVEVDNASSIAGFLDLTHVGYGVARTLCIEDGVTFFSVYSSTNGLLNVSTNGTAWIDGRSGSSTDVSPGWHEVMLSDSENCSVTLPDGQTIGPGSTDVSPIPMIAGGGPGEGRSFEFIFPYDGSGHTATITFNGAIETYPF